MWGWWGGVGVWVVVVRGGCVCVGGGGEVGQWWWWAGWVVVWVSGVGVGGWVVVCV